MDFPNIDLTLFKHILRFDTTINPEQNVFPTNDCAEYIKEYAKKNDFEIVELKASHYQQDTQNPKIYPVLLIKRGTSAGKNVLFLGHIDVVPVTNIERPDWHSDPFEPELLEDNYLRARGASDMKGGVVAFLSAFKDHNILNGNLIIALSGDEEIGGFDSVPIMLEHLKQMNLLPHYVINGEPSKKPVIVTKRRGATWIKLRFKEAKAVASGELREIEFKSIQGDGSETLHSMAFVLGADSHAMISAGKFCMDKKIVSVSSSSVKTNAVPKKVKVKYIETDVTEPQPIEYSKSLSDVMGALASFGSINWPIIPSKYGMAANPNILNYHSDTGVYELIFDFRAMYKDKTSHIALLQTLKSHVNLFGTQVEGEILNSIDPVNVDPESFLPQLVNIVAGEENLEIVSIGEKFGGASDTRFFTEIGIPGVELGPEGYNDHGTNEKVSLESLSRLIKIYQKAFNRLANSEKSSDTFVK